jgi:hypothetical protein
MQPQTQATEKKKKKDNLNFFKIEKFCGSKGTIKGWGIAQW